MPREGLESCLTNYKRLKEKGLINRVDEVKPGKFYVERKRYLPDGSTETIVDELRTNSILAIEKSINEQVENIQEIIKDLNVKKEEVISSGGNRVTTFLKGLFGR